MAMRFTTKFNYQIHKTFSLCVLYYVFFIMCSLSLCGYFCGFCGEYLPAKIHPSNSYPATAVIVWMVY
jgi:hypothetical protein